jgi:hypothetical protein
MFSPADPLYELAEGLFLRPEQLYWRLAQLDEPSEGLHTSPESSHASLEPAFSS